MAQGKDPYKVAVEGLSGTGKSKVIEILVSRLACRRILAESVSIEFMPDASKLLKRAKGYPRGDIRQSLLFWYLRLEQGEYARERGRLGGVDVVFFDRFWGSTLAIDRYGNGVPDAVLDWVMQGTDHENGPDLVLFFDAPLYVVRRRKDSKTLREGIFASKLWNGYLELAKEKSWHRIDANQKVEYVVEQCLEVVLEGYYAHWAQVSGVH